MDEKEGMTAAGMQWKNDSTLRYVYASLETGEVSPIYEEIYTYGGNGRISSFEHIPEDPLNAHIKWRFTYDRENQLKEKTIVQIGQKSFSATEIVLERDDRGNPITVLGSYEEDDYFPYIDSYEYEYY